MIGRLLRGGFMTAIYAYLYIPIIILIVNSFNSSRFGINWQGFTTKWYELLVNNDSLLQAAQHSLTMAIFSATFATLIGSLTAVAAGWLLSFTLSMDDVVVSSFVTGPGYEILPLKIYSMVKVGVSPEVNALATVLLVLSLVMVIASQLIARDKTKGR